MNAHSIAHKRLSGSLLRILLSTLAVLFGCVFPLAAQTFYVSSGNDILSVGPTGAVSTYAIFTANAQAAGLAVDAKGNLFVGDSDYGVIREVTPNGTLSVVAMLPASSAAITGLTFDASGNLYVADGNILEINPAGVVSTFATLPTNAFPQGLAFDSSGNLYAADGNIAQISKITPGGVVSTFASLTANSYPYGLAFDGGGNLYVAGLQTSQINKITSAGMVSTFANLLTNSYPEGLAFDGTGNLYSGDIYTNQISKISPAGSVSTFASNVQNASFLALQPVPEPSTWTILMLMSGGAMVLYRWRRMQRG